MPQQGRQRLSRILTADPIALALGGSIEAQMEQLPHLHALAYTQK